MGRVKIIVTLGPSSIEYDVVKRMVKEGASGVRINCAHGDEKSWMEYARIARDVAAELDTVVPLILDTPGPQARSGDFTEFTVNRGDTVVFTLNRDGQGEKNIWLPMKAFYTTVSIGDTLLYGDGELSFRVVDVEDSAVRAVALNSGVAKPRKKVVVEGKEYEASFPGEVDKRVFKFAADVKASFIALSYVKKRRDVEIARDLLAMHGWTPGLIAKIETRSGFINMRDILEVADGLIVARGDLGLHFPLEEIPLIQEQIVREVVKQGKIVIVATEVLESMVNNPRPSRSDVVDLYNSVFNLVDAVLLTNETAIGRYPVEAVKWAKRIIEKAELGLSRSIVNEYRSFIPVRDLLEKYVQGLILLSESIGGVIVDFSRTGRVPTLLSKLRPQTSVYIGVSDKLLAEKLTLRYGLNVIEMSKILPAESDYERGVARLRELLVETGRLKPGDIVIETYARPHINVHEIRISQVM
ncbi:MAG: pyruvate kinase [Desulfurococcus sp.]|nr:pyruvate kinase [Desulfurococcus sp.]